MTVSLFQPLLERTLGQFPVSIPTSLALEGAFGVLEEAEVSPPPILDTDELWINVHTLIRNLINTLETADKNKVLPEQLYETLILEMESILTIVDEQTNGKVKVQYFICTMKSLKRKFPDALLKTPNTSNQLNQATLEIKTIQLFLTMDHGLPFLNFDVNIEGNGTNAFIVTHTPINLLSGGSFRSLKLLESHTGSIKPNAKWYTKYKNGSKLQPLPFNRLLLQIFGDSDMFNGFPSKVKKEILSIAEKRRWTPNTTRDKIMYGVNNDGSKELSDLVQTLYKPNF